VKRRSRSEAAYALLLRLFPAGFRERFEDDLLDLFHDKHRQAAVRGTLALVPFWGRIARDALVTAIAERVSPSQVLPERGPIMQNIVQDIRYAGRMMARRPALAIIIILTLALGIGANTAIFSLVNTVLLRGLPYPQPDRLVMIREQQPERNVDIRPVAPANFFDWKARTSSFEDVAWSRDVMVALTGDGGEPESITAYRFSANMLSVLGVEPALGRGFTADDDKPGAPGVVILSDKLWRRRYGADRGILGRTITLSGQPYTIIGVMGPEFKHPQRTELWLPMALTPTLAADRDRAVLRLVGRLKPGVTREQAQRDVASVYQELAARHPQTNAGLTAKVDPFGTAGDAKPLLLILFAGVGFVLLIACANVANLLLADATARRRELAVRTALGATRYRVVRQMLTESVMLSLAGGVLGALVTWWTKDALVVIFPSNIANLNLPLIDRVDVGPAVFLFAFAVSIVIGFLFGTLPAWNVARSNLQEALKEGDRGGSASRRTHGVLVIAEVALSIVLLAGALLMVQSFIHLQKLQFGFDTEHVLSGRVLLPSYKYRDPERTALFAHELLPKLQSIPGVESAGIVNYLPLSGWSGEIDFAIEGRPPETGARVPSAGFQIASEDYFRTMGIRLLAGRTFTERDHRNAPRVVIASESLAKRYWPAENPVGRHIYIQVENGQRPYEIVGVVADVRAFGLEDPAPADLYFPLRQNPSSLLCMVLRTKGDPGALVSQLRAAVWSIDREQPVMYVMLMSELASESLAFRRAGMTLAGAFAALALVLAAIGIYGVLSYSITRRTREIGVRVALGATRAEVARLVLREGLTMTAIGIALGVGAALALSRYLASVLFQVKPADPLTYAAVAVILTAVAVLATLIPARRAAAVDPLVALRAE
jgi:putative ABC transport system permease protein